MIDSDSNVIRDQVLMGGWNGGNIVLTRGVETHNIDRIEHQL